jgi:hypothetical protein
VTNPDDRSICFSLWEMVVSIMISLQHIQAVVSYVFERPARHSICFDEPLGVLQNPIRVENQCFGMDFIRIIDFSY